MSRVGNLRWWAAGAGAVAAVGLVSTVSLVVAESVDGNRDDGDSSQGCKLHKLATKDELLNGNSGEVTGMSPDGKYLVGGLDNPVIWHDGKTTELADGTLQEAIDVSSSGTVAGLDGHNGGGSTAWMWEDGELTDLKMPKLGEFEDVEVIEINDDGVIIGNITFDDGIDQHKVRPLKWDTEKPDEVEELSFGGDDKVEGGAKALGEDGTILGNTEDDKSKAWKWDGDEEGSKLAVPDAAADSLGAFSWATAGDWLVTNSHAWKIGDPDQYRSVDLSGTIDANGVVYGITEDDEHAFADDEKLTKLPGLAKEPETHNGVAEVSHNGDLIAGQAVTDDGEIYPVTWTCD